MFLDSKLIYFLLLSILLSCHSGNKNVKHSNLNSADDQQTTTNLIKSEMLNDTWHDLLKDEFEKSYMIVLDAFLHGEIAAGKQVLPEPQHYFAALNTAAFEDVKVVILGQDPYPTPGNPHGLSFSVQDDVKVPASLANIFKEQENDLGIDQPFNNGNLMQPHIPHHSPAINSLVIIIFQKPMLF